MKSLKMATIRQRTPAGLERAGVDVDAGCGADVADGRLGDDESDDEFTDAPGRGRLRRRRRVLLTVIIFALLASVGGVLASTLIKSPAEIAAQTAPPPLSRLTATVQRVVITNTVLAQGVVHGPPLISGPAAQGNGLGSSGALPMVTQIFTRPGHYVLPGRPIVELAGRPVFAFAGSVPAFRNLVSGESGKDVAQLQAGLQSLGYSTGADPAGVFGPGTRKAVAAFYRGIGYAVPTMTAGPKAAAGAMVPLSEIMFIPRFPAVVFKIGASVGKTATGPLVTLSLGSPAISGQLNPNDAGLVRAGMKVRITNPVTGTTIGGTVRSVTPRMKTTHSISGGIYLPMGIVTDHPLPTTLIGQNVTLTIEAARSKGPVLAVPEAAIFAGADGVVYVSKVTGPNSQVRVAVRIGITGDGLIQVTATGGGTLAAGDSVVTGQAFLATLPGGRARTG